MMSVLELLAASPPLFVGTCLLFGLLVGSFLNVVIHRVPVILDRQWRAQCAELNASDSPTTGVAHAAAKSTSTSAKSPTRGPTLAPTTSATSGATASPAARTASAAPATPAEPTEPAEPSASAAPSAPAAPAAVERYNLVIPRSACPACQAPIGALQNIPVVSYLVLKGRCSSCGVRISARYPLVEILTGVLSALVAWKFGFGWPTAAALVLTWFLIALTFIDVDHQLLPDSLTLPLLWIGLSLSLWGTQPGLTVPVDVRSSIIGAVAGYLSLWSVYHLFRLLTGKEGMGYGDFKLFAALGAWLGWQMLIPIILIAALVGAIVGIALLALRGQSRSTPIAFGPFLAASGWLMLMFGQEAVSDYLGLFAPHT